MRQVSRLVLPVIPALLAFAPDALANNCTSTDPFNVVTNVACEYPPYEDDFGPVTNTSGIDDGRAALPTDPVDDILHRVTIPRSGFYTDTATCNDGSPAVMYVRKALAPADEDKWVIVLEGGGSGFDAINGDLDAGMWARWTGPDALDWYRKASTDWLDGTAIGRDGVPDTPEELVVQGVLDSTYSAFADWNWVFINYCSSDQWTGRSTAVDLPDAGYYVLGGNEIRGFKMDFHGHYIIEATLALLRRNFSWGTDMDPNYAMPDIDDATTVLVAGESAGSAGVKFNLDYIDYALSYYNPGVAVFGSLGAGLTPEPSDPSAAWWIDGNLNGVDDVEEAMRNQWNQIVEINGFTDVSCNTNHGDWTCVPIYFLINEISTPVFVKQDLRDSLLRQPYNTISDFTAGVRQAFDDFDAIGGLPYFGPNCAKHETLTSPGHYTNTLQKHELVGGVPQAAVLDEISYNDALWRFVDGSSADPFAYGGKVFNEGGTDYVWLANCP